MGTTRPTTGPKPGTTRSANAKRKVLDANIRQIFEEEARRGDALRHAIQYLFETDKAMAVHVYLKLLNTKQIANPVRHVTNIRTESFNARGVIAHMEELAELAQIASCPAPMQNESILFVDDGSETY